MRLLELPAGYTARYKGDLTILVMPSGRDFAPFTAAADPRDIALEAYRHAERVDRQIEELERLLSGSSARRRR